MPRLGEFANILFIQPPKYTSLFRKLPVYRYSKPKERHASSNRMYITQQYAAEKKVLSRAKRAKNMLKMINNLQNNASRLVVSDSVT